MMYKNPLLVAGVCSVLQSWATRHFPTYGLRMTTGMAQENIDLAHIHGSHLPPEVFYDRVFMRILTESGEPLWDGVKFVHHTNGTLERIILRLHRTRTVSKVLLPTKL